MITKLGKVKRNDFYFSRASIRQLRRMVEERRQNILKHIRYFFANQDPLEFAEELIDFRIGQYRYKVGEDNVIFNVGEGTFMVLLIGTEEELLG